MEALRDGASADATASASAAGKREEGRAANATSSSSSIPPPFDGPDVISYATVADAWAKSGDVRAGVKAESILRRLEEGRGGDEGRSGGGSGVRPNVVLYNAVIDAWARSGDLDGGRRALAVLRRMMGGGGGSPDAVRPNVVTYTGVIAALARSGGKGGGDAKIDAGEEAESLLVEMGRAGVRPNTATYNAVLLAWAGQAAGTGNRTAAAAAPERAEDLLCLMEGGAAPNTALLRPPHPCPPPPDQISYNTVLKAWAESDRPDAAIRARDLLLRMEGGESNRTGAGQGRGRGRRPTTPAPASVRPQFRPPARPDVISYNTVLNACARAGAPTTRPRTSRPLPPPAEAGGGREGKEGGERGGGSRNDDDRDDGAALEIALETYRAMKSGRGADGRMPLSPQPNRVTYATMINVVGRLLPSGDDGGDGHVLRLRLIRDIFADCRRGGMMCDATLRALRCACASREEYRQILGRGDGCCEGEDI